MNSRYTSADCNISGLPGGVASINRPIHQAGVLPLTPVSAAGRENKWWREGINQRTGGEAPAPWLAQSSPEMEHDGEARLRCEEGGGGSLSGGENQVICGWVGVQSQVETQSKFVYLWGRGSCLQLGVCLSQEGAISRHRVAKRQCAECCFMWLAMRPLSSLACPTWLPLTAKIH